MFFESKIPKIVSSKLRPKSQKSFPAPVVLNHASYGYLDKIETEFIFFGNMSTCFGVDFVVLSVGAD